MQVDSVRTSRSKKVSVPAAKHDGRPKPRLGHFAPIVCAAGVGLLICAVANAMSRGTVGTPMPLYWVGILAIALPIFYRLTSKDASPAERLALVCLLGLSLYGVKVMRDAPLFTFSDEMIHAFNANRIGADHHLFGSNPILEVTPYYPGLEGATSALTKLTGLSTFTAGVVLVGVARLVLIASLFLLFQRISGSARVAGLGAAIYAGNFNFLFWGAQYSYESLALPLLLLAMMALAEREAGPRAALRSWAVPAILAMVAIVVTHHVTSYALTATLAALSLAYWYIHRNWRPPNPWPFAALGAALVLAWLVVVASSTVGYLTPVIGNALDGISSTIGGEDAPRGLFQNTGSTVPTTPLAARAVAVLAIALLAAGLPFGLRELRRYHMRKPFALLFGLAAIGFFATLALRLAPPAWETGNRASEFLFVGLAFVLACACLEALRRWPGRREVRGLLAGGIGLVVVGGAIAGWPWDSQLAQPLRISAAGQTLPSPPLAMAEWAAERTPEERFAASAADANLLLTPGGRAALAGSSPDIEDIIDEERLAGWELPLLRRNEIRYLVGDRRPNRSDVLRGYYFAREGSAAAEMDPKALIAKFNRIPGAARVYTNGQITVFDLEGRR